MGLKLETLDGKEDGNGRSEIKNMTRQEIINLENECNQNLLLGGICYANCKYRENGHCELTLSKVLKEAIEELKKDYVNNCNNEY